MQETSVPFWIGGTSFLLFIVCSLWLGPEAGGAAFLSTIAGSFFSCQYWDFGIKKRPQILSWAAVAFLLLLACTVHLWVTVVIAAITFFGPLLAFAIAFAWSTDEDDYGWR